MLVPPASLPALLAGSNPSHFFTSFSILQVTVCDRPERQSADACGFALSLDRFDRAAGIRQDLGQSRVQQHDESLLPCEEPNPSDDEPVADAGALSNRLW
jgi:hypothetical protein